MIRNTFLAKRANSYNGQSIPLFELEHLYRRQYGYALRPEDFGQSSLKGVIGTNMIYFFSNYIILLPLYNVVLFSIFYAQIFFQRK